MELNNLDKELINIATETVEKNKDLYGDSTFVVAAAVRAKSGKIYTGVNVRTHHSICAEQVAIGNAFTQGERELESIVAVKLENNGKSRVVSPCGLCRYTFDKLKMYNLNVIVADNKNNSIVKVNMHDLLPYPYVRYE